MADTSVIFNILARDNATSTFNKVGKSMLTIAGGVISGQAILGGISKGFAFAKGAAIDFNSELQQSTIAFTTMLGSGQKSKAFLDQLQSFAKSTPFEFGNLVSNAQNMMGMGVAAKNVIPDLRALGDSVASIGGSAQQVDSVTLAFDQMTAKGTLDMGNMNQLMQNGVPSALKVLAASYNVTTGQMIKMISTGKVQSSVALPALIAGIEKGTKSTAALGGMMDKQSQTFSGAMSNISDSMTQALAKAFQPFFGIVSSGAQMLAGWLGSSTFTTFGAKISGGITDVINIVKFMVGWITGNGSDAIDGFSDNAFKKVEGIAAVVNRVFQTVRTVIGNVIGFVTGTVIPVAKDLVKTFGPILAGAFGIGLVAIKNLSDALGPLGSGIKTTFGFIADHATTFRALAITVGVMVGAMKAWTLATSIWTGVTKLARDAQVAFSLAMDISPIGLIIIGVAALAAGIYYLWTHSSGFRDFFIGMWNDIWGFLKGVGSWFAGPFLDFFKGVANWFMGWGKYLLLLLGPIGALGLAALEIWQHWSTVWGFFKAIGAWFAGPFVNFFVGAWNGIAGSALWLWHNVLDPMWEGITGGIKFVMNIVTSLINLWLYLANMVIQPVWNGIIKPAITGMGQAFLWLWQTVFMPMVTGFVIGFHLAGDAATWLWNNAVMPAFHGIADLAGWLWHSVIEPFGTGIWTAIKTVGAGFTWLWHNAIEPAFHGVQALTSWVWHNVLDPAWSGIKKGVNTVGDTFKSVFNSVKDHVSTIFGVIVSAIKGAVNSVIDVINGAIGGIDSVISKANKIPGVNFPTIPKIPHLAAGGIVRARPGGVLALLGEGGRDEQVSPLPRGGGGIGGGGTIHVDVHLHGGAVNASVREVQAYVRESFAGDVDAALRGHA